VPHRLIWLALEIYRVPPNIVAMLKSYFTGFHLRFSTAEYTTEWAELEIGIAAGCTVSPILFVMAMQLILKASENAAEGPDLGGGCRMPPLKAFLDDTTVLSPNEGQARLMLKRLDELMVWSRMQFKPKKSRSLSIVRGKVVDTKFDVSGQRIPTVREEPVKSLGRMYNAALKDTAARRQTIEMSKAGLDSINRCRLLGKFKTWCVQFVLIPKLLWPLLIYEIPSSTVAAMEQTISKYLRKWMGLHPSVTDVAMYSKRAKLALPLKSLVEEYKVGKSRLVLMTEQSSDPFVRAVAPKVNTGPKWQAHKAVQEAKESAQLKEIIGHTQTTRRGFGHESKQWWSKATKKGQRDIVIGEIRNTEEEKRVVKAVQQVQQGRWTQWDDALQRSLSWNDIWQMAPLRLSFIIRSVYDMLPSGTNLVKWGKIEDESCPLCHRPQSLEHVLSACKKALCQGRYTWRHNRVLSTIAHYVDNARRKANLAQNCEVPSVTPPIRFLRAGVEPQTRRKKMASEDNPNSFLNTAVDWELSVDLSGYDKYPEPVKVSGLRPDLVVHSTSTKRMCLVELTVPWESRINEQHEFKTHKYGDLVAELKRKGHTVELLAVEVGARGLVAPSVFTLLKKVGLRGGARSRALKEIAESAEKASSWIWSRRNSLE
jgi:hypothetical protein